MSEADKARKALERTERAVTRHHLEAVTERSILDFAARERESMTGPARALASMSAADFDALLAIVRHARRIPESSERTAYIARQCEARVTDYADRLASSAASRSAPCATCKRGTDNGPECHTCAYARECAARESSAQVP